MKPSHIFALSTAIGALLTIVQPTNAAKYNTFKQCFILLSHSHRGICNTETFVSTSRDDVLEDALAECWPTKKYALIVHGWRESCNTPWVKELRQNLITHRGGCILCMDYRDYDDDYGFLLINFKSIAKILTDKLDVLSDLSFDSSQSLLFGFSYGARLIVKAATDFGPRRIGNIHLCEMAGPGFDGNPMNADPKKAAINSQCIHTASGGYGTRERTCHQNWLMGNCGESQIGQRCCSSNCNKATSLIRTHSKLKCSSISAQSEIEPVFLARFIHNSSR